MDISLRDHYDARLADMDKRYAQRFESAEVALSKAADIGWREELATKSELAKIDSAVRDLQTARANLDGKIAAYSVVISSAVSLILWALTNVFGVGN